MGGDITIETERLVLREFRRDDTWLRGHWRSSHLYSILESEWSPGERRDPAGSRDAHGPAGSGRARHEEERR